MVTSPEWVSDLVAKLGALMVPDEATIILGWRWQEPQHIADSWSIMAFPTPGLTEGRDPDAEPEFDPEADEEDSREFILVGFSADVTGICKLFDKTPRILWLMPTNYDTPEDLAGARLAFDGYIEGRPVLLQLFSDPPFDEEPTFIFNLADGTIIELPPECDDDEDDD